LYSGKRAGFLSFSPYRVAAAKNIKTISLFYPSQPEVVKMNKFWKEELQNKLKNKIYMWDEKCRLWRNAFVPGDTMTDGEYEAINFTLKLIGDCPHP
jgi:hypothetical protein